MKKLLLSAAVLLFSLNAYSQTFEYGVKAGLNISTLTEWSQFDMKPSVYAGIFAEYRVNDYLGIQPELLYSRQGAKRKNEGTKYWYRYDYINLPILAKIYPLNNLPLSIDVGPQFGYLINAKRKSDSPYGESTHSIKGTKDFEVAVAMGATYRLWEKLDISARFNLGLTKANEEITINGKRENRSSDDAKNAVIQVGAGLRF